MFITKNRVGWFSILVYKENQNFISIVTNLNYFICTGTYSSVLKKIKFKSEIGIYLRFHNEYQKQVYLADKSPTTSDLYQNSLALKMIKQLEFRKWDFCYIYTFFLKYKYVQSLH